MPFSFHLNRLGTWSVKNSDVSWKCFKKVLNYTICDSVKCCLVIQTGGDFPLFSAFFCFGTVYVSLTCHEDSFVVVWGPRFSLLPRHSRSPCEVPSLIYCDFLAENIDPLFLLIRYHDKLDSVLQFKNICLILIDCNFFYLKGLYGTLENIWNKVNTGKVLKFPAEIASANVNCKWMSINIASVYFHFVILHELSR